MASEIQTLSAALWHPFIEAPQRRLNAVKWSQMKSDEVWCSPNGKFCILIHNLWIRKGSQSLFFRVPNRLKEPWLFDADFQCRVPVFILDATECSHLLALTQNFWVKPPAKTLAKPSVHYSYVLRVALIRKAADNSSPSNLDALPLLQSVGSSFAHLRSFPVIWRKSTGLARVDHHVALRIVLHIAHL